MNMAELLHDLWWGQLAGILTNLVQGQRSHEALRSVAELIEADYAGRFLFELIQNGYDAAIRGDQQGSTIKIISDGSLLAVGNMGEPVTEERLRLLTTMGLSDKGPNESIGHKGVGFKSVFEVASSPAVLSAPGGAIDPEVPGLRFRISSAPFHAEKARTLLDQLAFDVVREPVPRGPYRPTKDDLVCAAHHAAPFQFPLGIERTDLDHWNSKLGRQLAGYDTVVVLQAEGEGARSKMVRAVDELTVRAEQILLFLHGLRALHIIDSAAGTDVHVERHLEGRRQLPTGPTLDRIRILRTFDGENIATEWWLATSSVGGGNDDVSLRLRDLVQDLGGSWSELDKVRVRCALPAMLDGDRVTQTGYFSVGLPTEIATGAAFWVDAPFYATTSRTGLKLDAPYNSFLLNAAKNAAEKLLIALRESPDVADRRLLGMSRGCIRSDHEGPLREWLLRDGGVLSGQCLLNRNCTDFLAPRDVGALSDDDKDVFSALELSTDLLPDVGIPLADRELDRQLANLLSAEEHEHALLGPAAFMQRHSPEAPIERVAQALIDNKSVPDAWNTFFKWVLGWSLDDDGRALRENLKILPLMGGGLASAAERVFLMPARWLDRDAASEPESSSRNDDDGKLPEPDTESEDDEVDVPDLVRSDLRFLDPKIPTRDSRGRRTELGNRLSDERSGLVRLPRKAELLRYAVAPALASAAHTSGDIERAYSLLSTAVSLLHGDRAEDARREALLLALPVPGNVDPQWIPANEAYLGTEWLDPDHDQLLRRAVRKKATCRLQDWQTFREMSKTSHDRDWWLAGMEWLGVAGWPRIIRERARGGGTPTPRFNASYGGLRIATSRFPRQLPDALHEAWEAYIRDVARTPVSHVANYITYDIVDIEWIEGLDDEDCRNAVVDCVLRASSHYTHIHTRVDRVDTRARGPAIPIFWVHLLAKSGWRVFPDREGGRCPASEIWWPEQQPGPGESRYSHVSVLAAPRSIERALLDALHIVDIDQADFDRALSELVRQAHRLDGGVDRASRPLRALIADLFQRIEAGIRTDSTIEIRPSLLGSVLPLVRHGQLEAVQLSDLSQLFIDDDHVRQRLIAAPEDACYVPIRSRERLDGMASALAGHIELRYASNAPLGFPYTPTQEPERLLGRLHAELTNDTMLALGCCIASVEGTSPRGERFRQIWRSLAETEIQCVLGPEELRLGVLQPIADGEARRLLILDGPDVRFRLVEATRCLLGTQYIPTLTLLARALQEGGLAVERLLEELDIRPSQREAVREVIEAGDRARVDELLPALWVLAESTGRASSPTACAELVARCSSIVEAIAAVAGTLDRDEVLDLAAHSIEPDLSLALVHRAGCTARHWQEARAAFGRAPYRFADSETEYRRLLRQAEAVLRCQIVAFSRQDPPLEEARSYLEGYTMAAIPDEVSQQPLSEQNLPLRIFNDLKVGLQSASHDLRASLEHRISAFSGSGAADPFPRHPQMSRAQVAEYESDRPESERSRAASQILEQYVPIIDLLATTNGLLRDSIAVDSRLATLTSGFWANQYLVLKRLRELVTELAPEVAASMQAIGDVFTRPYAGAELGRRLGLSDPGVAVPMPKVEMLGLTLNRAEIVEDLSKGESGELGARIAGLATSETGIDELLELEIDKVLPPSGAGGRARNHKQPPRERDDELIGDLGEIYVYHWLLRHLNSEGFGHTHWVSRAKHRYLQVEGDDTLGFDFVWNDQTGFFGLAGRVCLLEVKASSHASLGFHLSRGEWLRALQAHEEPDEHYVIVRVINVAIRPRIAAILRDPIALEHDRRIRLESRDMRVSVGRLATESQSASSSRGRADGGNDDG